jgi:glutamine amidotransferase
MITIIDYGSGNIKAISNIYETLNVQFTIASSPEQLVRAKKIFLPGVGAFDETISKLDSTGFREVLDREVLINKVPILGICVGMQILAERSDEGNLKGLGYIKGSVKKIDVQNFTQKPKLPHMGWNSIQIEKENQLVQNIDPKFGFYFLHSYYFDTIDENNVLATTQYGEKFACAVFRDNVYGVQFHPEKSHVNGIRLLQNFANL